MEYRTEQHGNAEVGVVIHEGREFKALGAVISGDRIAAYLGKHGQLTNWAGEAIGTYRITKTWRTPHLFLSSTMSQVIATVDGKRYQGRSAGEGMLFRGKLTKSL